MSIPKRKFREIVFQLLYSQDIASEVGERDFTLLMEQAKVSRNSMREAYEQVLDIQRHIPELDQMIQEASKEYDFERIHRVERNILRLGFYELYFAEGVPPKVAIAEAIRLSKKFSTPESVKFINALLDQALPKGEGEEDKAAIFWKNENRSK